jgi:hypothetical protein
MCFQYGTMLLKRDCVTDPALTSASPIGNLLWVSCGLWKKGGSLYVKLLLIVTTGFWWMVHSAYLWTRTDCHNKLGAEIQRVQWWTMANPFGKCVALHVQKNPQRIQTVYWECMKLMKTKKEHQLWKSILPLQLIWLPQGAPCVGGTLYTPYELCEC